MDPIPSILQFERVGLAAGTHHFPDLDEVTFDAGPGAGVMVLQEADAEAVPLADLAEGLLNPDRGTVRFRGQTWSEGSGFDQNARRGRIGRVFEKNGWISNLNVRENLLLAQRHHGRRPDADIRAEAEDRARQVGLDGVPETRPDVVRKGVLRRLEWVRAFMGEPDLVLLERPERDAPAEFLGVLGEWVSATLDRGGAVLWTTLDERLWGGEGLRRGRRYRFKDGRLEEASDHG